MQWLTEYVCHEAENSRLKEQHGKMHRRLGSVTLSWLAFLPAKSGPNFPREKSQRNNTVVKKRTIIIMKFDKEAQQ